MFEPPSLLQELKQTRPFRSQEEEATVGILLTAERLRRSIARLLALQGLTPQQFNVLRILRGSHPNALPTLEIAARLIEEAPGITALLDRLEAKELVARKRSLEDRRCVLVEITTKGLVLLEKLDGPMLEHLSLIFREFRQQETEQLSGVLEKLRAGLVRVDRAGASLAALVDRPLAGEKGERS